MKEGVKEGKQTKNFKKERKREKERRKKRKREKQRKKRRQKKERKMKRRERERRKSIKREALKGNKYWQLTTFRQKKIDEFNHEKTQREESPSYKL